MQVTIVHVHVKPEHTDKFIEACRLNHESSVKEAGNRRFDILQSDIDPNRFVLYEAYSDAASAAEHKETKHYKLWRDTVADWMQEPRRGESYTGHFPNR